MKGVVPITDPKSQEVFLNCIAAFPGHVKEGMSVFGVSVSAIPVDDGIEVGISGDQSLMLIPVSWREWFKFSYEYALEHNVIFKDRTHAIFVDNKRRHRLYYKHTTGWEADGVLYRGYLNELCNYVKYNKH